MITYKSIHRRSNIEWFYTTRKGGGRKFECQTLDKNSSQEQEKLKSELEIKGRLETIYNKKKTAIID